MTAFKRTRLHYWSALVLASLAVLAGCETTELGALTRPAGKPADVTVEESRVADALLTLREKNPSITASIKQELHFAPLAGAAMQAANSGDRDTLRQQAKRAGNALWVNATQRAQQQPAIPLDDRPLYWRRLLEKREFKTACTRTDTDLCGELLAVFERASRGVADRQFATVKTANNLHIAISGFDPFGLDNHIDQSNPSGAAALALDGVQLVHNGVTAEIQAVMFPVRFADFDEGMVEDIFEPLITSGALNMLITISMGRSEFDLERFPGRRRSATAPDNLRVLTGASLTNPLIPLLAGASLEGPEFVEFSLPVDTMRRVQTPYPVNDNRTVTTLEGGEYDAASLAALNTQTAVRGGGGGYLSNEISYRTVRLVALHNKDIAVGHIHTPRISAYDAQAVGAITKQIRAMLLTALGAAQ